MLSFADYEQISMQMWVASGILFAGFGFLLLVLNHLDESEEKKTNIRDQH